MDINIAFNVSPFWQGFIACIVVIVIGIYAWAAMLAKKFNVW